MATIHKTMNYKQFKFFPSQRCITPNNLIASVSKKNMLHVNPIIVDQDFYVLDGQHRLKAAEVLQVPIYYIICTDITELDIPQLQVQRPWSLLEFTNFYSQKNQDYKFIKDCSEKYKWPVPMLVKMLIAGERSTVIYKEGRAKLIDSHENLTAKLEQLKELHEDFKLLAKKTVTCNALQAIWSVINIDGYDHEMFLRKLYTWGKEAQLALRFQNISDIKEQLINNVYNKRNKLSRIDNE